MPLKQDSNSDQWHWTQVVKWIAFDEKEPDRGPGSPYPNSPIQIRLECAISEFVESLATGAINPVSGPVPPYFGRERFLSAKPLSDMQKDVECFLFLVFIGGWLDGHDRCVRAFFEWLNDVSFSRDSVFAEWPSLEPEGSASNPGRPKRQPDAIDAAKKLYGKAQKPGGKSWKVCLGEINGELETRGLPAIESVDTLQRAFGRRQ
ncbi:MAG: hypothetical protein RIM72_22395 [Alphaproteobacteria bacterium]